MTQSMLGTLACLLLCANLAVAQASLGFRQMQLAETQAQPSAAAPAPLSDRAPPPADFAAPTFDVERTGRLGLLATYPASADWVSASTSYYWLRDAAL